MWLKQPLVDLAEITVRHDIVETFTSDPTLRESLRDQHLRGKLKIKHFFLTVSLKSFYVPSFYVPSEPNTGYLSDPVSFRRFSCALLPRSSYMLKCNCSTSRQREYKALASSIVCLYILHL